MAPDLHPARRLWHAIEPLHAVVYVVREVTAAGEALGLRGRWMGYFAGRFAPLGAVGPEPVAAMAYGFAPALVRQGLPGAWAVARPDDVVELRLAAAADALRARLAPVHLDALVALRGPLWDAVGACTYGGRPLAAAWSGVPRPDDPVADTWLATSVLREHRGDGHVVASVAAGLDGLDALLTMAATGAVDPERLRVVRGWTEAEWADGRDRLVARGLLGPDGALTPAGAEVRAAVEVRTDELAAGPVDRLGADGLARVLERAVPASRALFDGGTISEPNPIGVPRP